MKIFLSGYNLTIPLAVKPEERKAPEWPQRYEKMVIAKEREWFRRTGCKYRCYSFGYVCPKAFYYNRESALSLETALACQAEIMMDSGAFSFHRMLQKQTGQRSKKKSRGYRPEEIERLREETIDLYVAYCKAHGKQWDFYVNFDYEPRVPIAWKMQLRLEKLGLKPVPVFHGDEGLDWVRRYVDRGHKLLAIGTGKASKRGWRDKMAFYDTMFDAAEKWGFKLHGLAVTKPSIMTSFDFYGVDSATWGVQSAYGGIVRFIPDRRVWIQLHVTHNDTQAGASYERLSPEVQKEIRQEVENRGFDFDLMRGSTTTAWWERAMHNAWMFAHLEDFFSSRKKENSWEKLI